MRRYLNSFLVRVGGIWKKTFPQIDIPGGGGGEEKVEASIWLVYNTEAFLFITTNLYFRVKLKTKGHTTNVIVRHQDPMSRSMQLHYVPITEFSRTDLLLDRIFLKWDSRGSVMTNHKILVDVSGQGLPFFHKRKGILKIDQSIKMPWHRLSMEAASSYSSSPVAT